MIDAQELMRCSSELCRASLSGATMLSIRSGSSDVTPVRRDELLAKLANNEHVEIDIDVLAYEQKPGIYNRKYVRFRDGLMASLGRTGRGTPFLRDHEQCDLTARGGTVIQSRTEQVAPGHYQIKQTIRLSMPWAVEACLRGTIDRFSIGWNPTGAVFCSCCDEPVLEECSHLPGERFTKRPGSDGKDYLVEDPNGEVVCEWVFQQAELVETSAVSVPAVPSAQIDGIRASLTAALTSGTLFSGPKSGPMEKRKMTKSPALAGILGLAATAGDDEILSAVTGIKAKLDAVDAQCDELRRLQARAAAEAEVFRDQLAAREVEEFVTSGVNDGKLVPGSAAETSLRAYFRVDKDGARSLLSSLPRITPVGAPRQSLSAAPDSPVSTLAASVDAQIQQIGGTPGGVRAVLRALGSKPNQALARHGAKVFGLAVADEEE